MKYISIILAALLAVSFMVANYYRSSYYSLVSELKEKEMQSEIVKIEKEKEYAYSVIQTKDSIKSDTNDISENYLRIISSIDIDYANDSLHDSEDSESLSDNTRITTGISEDSSKQLEQCRVSFKRLEGEYLILARDADITAVHYNNLIDFYNKIYNQNR